MAKDNNYDASSITVLEGLEAVSPETTGYVYWKCIPQGTESSDLRDR